MVGTRYRRCVTDKILGDATDGSQPTIACFSPVPAAINFAERSTKLFRHTPRTVTFVVGALLAIFVLSVASKARAQNATWLLTPGSTNWNTAANWAPAAVPTGIATFGLSSVTSLTFSANASIGSILFLPGAPTYSFNLGVRQFTIGSNGLSTLIDGVVSGAGGSVVKSGAGTLTFTGANTYTGVTLISAGVLQLGAGGTTGSIVGNVTNNSIFAINRSDLYVYGGAISGTGAFQQLGPGTTVFTGNNTYSGGTLISAGLLQLGAGGTTGAIVGNVVNNAAFAINRSNNFTFAGVISGTGTFQQLGTGMTTFTGDNTYTGGTTITAGTLRLGNNGITGSILGDVINFGTFIINRSDTYTFAGAISGTGAFSKTGAGVTILTGTSTYTGGTTITGGTLQIGDGTTTGSIVGNVVNSAIFAINRSDLFTFAGVISGNGQFRQIGTGTTVLTGANTYTGVTLISAGVLQLGAGGTTGSIVGNVTNNSIFAINRSDLYVYGGAISGTGAFQQLGPGTTVFTGNNTYSGGTLISAGLLQLGAGGTTGAIVGNVVNNAAFAINRSNNFTFAGVISGTGTFQQLGTGMTTFTGDNTYTGGTTITAGTLRLGNNGITGSILGDVINFGTFIINRSDTYTFAGAISGTGAFSKTGAGVTILTGTSTYTGGTTITGGTLQIGDGTTTGSIVGNVVNSAIFAINRSDLFTFAGVISGNGQFRQIGTGTTVLTGANTYTGVTLISAGVLQLGAGGTTGSIVGNVTNNSIFAINRSDLYVYGGAISGTGAFQQLGPGTTVFTGNNTYSGGTLISAGLLQLGAGGTTGAIVGNVVNNAAFAINRSNNFTFAGVISGTGTFQQLGTGMTTFTGDNTYTGGTTITAGTLRLGNNGITGSILGDVINFGTFIINRSDTYTFAGAISGTGAFSKTGAGVTILTGTSTYTGGTTITGGTLQIGDGTTTGSIVGNVVNSAIFAINRSDLFTFAGVISGNGQFRQIGTGTTVLTGANTYTGVTLISAGVLQLGAGGTTGSIVGNVTNNSIFAINRSDLYVYGGAISGTGAFQQLGPGTTVFTGNNTYSGGTLISAGLLQLGAGGTTGAIVGNVVNNAAFAINRSNNFTFAGVISGTGTFQQLGTGMTTFTGDNTYTGGTTITAGTLRLGNNGITGSILGDVINFGTFIINRSDTYTFAGAISGTGAFSKTGAGVTILTGTSTYTGGTTITGGTLQIGDGTTTGSIVGNVVNSAIFAINRSDLFTFAGVISGNGQFRQIGTGITYFSGASTYTGATFVDAGTLVVDGSIASSSGLTVAAGAMLAGNGIVSSTTINTGGVIAPGLAIGLLTVQGNLVFQTGSAYFAEFSPSNADSIVVTGTATLAGNVQASFQLGSYVPANYTILSATGGLTGTFDSLTTLNLPNYFTAGLSYSATDVFLNLSLGLGQIPGLNRNQRAVAAAIDRAFNAGGGIGGPLTALFSLLPASLPAALTQLSGEVAVGAQQAASFAMNSFLPMLLNPFNDNRVGAIGFGPTVGNSIEPWGPLASTTALAYAPSI